MRSVKDSISNTWTIGITYGAIRKVKAETGHDLGLLVVGEPPLLVRLKIDPLTVGEIVWALVKEQAGKLAISHGDFWEFWCDKFFADMQKALLEELADFFQKTIPAIAEAIRKADKAVTDGLAAVLGTSGA